MAIPAVLPNGMVLVYGWGHTQGISGIVPTTQRFLFATVYQIWDGGEVFVYGGDNVMWKEGDEYCKLTYANNPYTMIPARLVTKEFVLP